MEFEEDVGRDSATGVCKTLLRENGPDDIPGECLVGCVS